MSKYFALDKIAQAMRPTYVNGSWRKPALSARQIARVRQEAYRYGTINGVPARICSSSLGRLFILVRMESRMG